MLVFDPVKHVYTNQSTGEVYTSVTTLIGKYKKPFDAKLMAERVARRDGTTATEVQAKWKKLNDDSKEYGTKIHSVIEEYNKSGTIDSDYTDIIQSYVDLGVLSKKDTILSEEKLHLHPYKIAGTADIIRVEDKGGFSIFDIKTNKKFNFFSQYGEELLSPLSHLSSCEYTIYSLQLSAYAYMYQSLTGRHVNQLGIFYYDRELKKFHYYPIPYMKSDILALLEHYEKS